VTVIHAPAMLTGLGHGKRAMIARRSPAQRKSGVQGVPERSGIVTHCRGKVRRSAPVGEQGAFG